MSAGVPREKWLVEPSLDMVGADKADEYIPVSHRMKVYQDIGGFPLLTLAPCFGYRLHSPI